MASPVDSEIFSWIFVGGREFAKNFHQLKSKRIKYVLNVTPHSTGGGVPNYYERDTYFTYCRVPLQDNASEKLSTYYEKAWEFLERARIREDGSILVHCNQGISRSVAVVCSYLMKYFQLPFKEALPKLQDSRPQARPNDSFMLQLQQLDAELKRNQSYATSIVNLNSPRTSSLTLPKKRSANLIVGASRGPLKERTNHSHSCPSSSSLLESEEFTSKQNSDLTDAPKRVCVIGPLITPWISEPTSDYHDWLSKKGEKGQLLIGPCLPPSTSDLLCSKESTVIGPSLPPSTALSRKSTAIGPSLPPSTSDLLCSRESTVIGPSLPPSTSLCSRESTVIGPFLPTDSSSSSTISSPTGCSLSPSTPPSLSISSFGISSLPI